MYYVQVAQLTGGYSGSDLASLARDAAYGPIRELKIGTITQSFILKKRIFLKLKLRLVFVVNAIHLPRKPKPEIVVFLLYQCYLYFLDVT
jgi:hypothetical protein